MYTTTIGTISQNIKSQTRLYFRRLLPVDILVIGHCTVMILLLSFKIRKEGSVAVPFILKYAAIMAAAMFVAPAVDQSRHPAVQSSLVKLFRNIYPVFLMTPFYQWTYPIGKIFFSVPFDSYLMRADIMLFGFNIPRDLVHRCGDRVWLTEWLNFSYLSYYLLTLYLPFYLYAARRTREFFYTAFISGTIMFSCFVFHAVFPARGPLFFDTAVKGYLEAGPISEFARFFLMRADIPGGAMPSSHIAGTVAVLLLARRFARPAFWITLPVAASLCIATVYCRYHYAVDGIAGILVALAGVYWIGPRLYARLFPDMIPDDDTPSSDTAKTA
jgi:membrane-associated phospholipid phosphatase